MVKLPEGIPDKIFFSISEVAEITGLKQHILRYWESEFGALKPQKGSDGRRRYRLGDIEKVLEIKELLYVEKYTIAGARRRMELERRGDIPSGAKDIVGELQDDLGEILGDLE
ncbi:MAG: MerR family transcriptional regulator [bacterium]|nr:MerR family transcriptional regulator [bacterium]